MNKYNVVIGIEIHLELNTKTKMFSSAANSFNQSPNTNVDLIDVAYPGTLPLPNKQAIVKAIKLAKALNMEIDNELHFDRKNYFYPDLPKGFQITQQFRPIGKNGYLKIEENNQLHKISIERIHLEEDTAKQIHTENGTFLDYNRAGVPLIEIVSNPVIKNAEQAAKYVEAIARIAKFLNISDAKLEEGSLRADINLSLNKKDEPFGTKVEIKNINSISNIKKAIELEIKEQSQKLDSNIKIKQETKRFDDVKQINISMREKTGAIDYRYFPEPNIPVMKLEKEFINSITIEKLHWQWEEELKNKSIPANYVEQLINNYEWLLFFDKINFVDKFKVAKLFFSEIVPLIKEKGLNNININAVDIEKILNLEKNNKISSKQVKEIILLKEKENLTIEKLIEKYNIKQIEDDNLIIDLINKLIESNSHLLAEFENRPERVIKFFLGQIMKETKGQVNPQLANDLLIKTINIKLNK
ncbi:Asp-tRNA(Asn)/Glu-tRNA(Gln) amidotransferase subunit GatB [Mesomycoplasma lagogenitalium]|uniref:Aspartyl/glutamyl-tRNA(Asn/Gln) amidotransferase subunit B n=1 Tax=Mesomycoplasma lagogenitalium TaxID=171286 RepID=A0ABY8LW55_9BACT|nr:Asp-tRNA(Asn)/Glu-tRNA(Gln) amidotransferase subunit GatB [Mesomycoplasma lagogenitalium]WGI36528.1 Asp-tRNA(Asn)/Glu-tRNA(Gln) amidotransferase subunit GatB [Mesomycoplasma lagogenitalium]